MTEEEAEKVLDRGHEYFKNAEYEKAIECWEKIPKGKEKYYNTQLWIGLAYNNLGECTKAIERWRKIPKGNENYYASQLSIGLAYNSLEEYTKAIEYWREIPEGNEVYYYAQYWIGSAYIFEEPSKHKNAIESWNRLPPNHKFYTDVQYFIGLTYIGLQEEKKASEAIINSQKEVFDLLGLFNQEEIKKDPEKTGILKKVLSTVLDKKTDDFFNTTVAKDVENRPKYREIFIESLHIISLLHVSNEHEKQIAHYTRKWAAERMLFAKSKLRLNSTISANDPKEGVTLLDFLGIENKTHLQSPYQAFIACFTFNHESLNQFRLYGKEDNKEATGVSIILKNDFFDSSPGIAGLNTKNDLDIQTNTSETENKKETPAEERLSLYRCVYIDPNTKKVISIGHKEEYNFYRENNDIPKEKVDKYKTEIDNILNEVRTQMKKLKFLIKDNPTLDESIISELLLPLRHLTKHVAFKEEQECRIFDIENLETSDKIKPQRNQEEKDCDKQEFHSMYIDYGADISKYVKKVIFAPKADGLNQFDAFAKYLGHKITCEQCDHPFSSDKMT